MSKSRAARRRKKRRDDAQQPPPPVSKTHVMVAVPCVGDYAHLGVTYFLHQLDRLSLLPSCPWSFSWVVKTGVRPVEYARNKIVGDFLKSDAERLWFIDHDMICDQTAMELLNVPGDIVSGAALAYKRRDGKSSLELCAFKYNVKGDNKFNPIEPHHGAAVIDIDGCGAACMVIKRHVLEDKRLWNDGKYEWYGETFDCVDDNTDKEGDWAPPVFRTIHKPNGEILRGEDLDFCLRAKGLGYSIRLHAGVDVGHSKEMNLSEAARIAHRAVQVNVERVTQQFQRVQQNGKGEVHRQDESGVRKDGGVRRFGVESLRRVVHGAQAVGAGGEEAQESAAQG